MYDRDYPLNIKQKMSDIIRCEADAIAGIEITDNFEDAVNLILQSSGKVITTGIGKAGFVAHRLALSIDRKSVV